MDKKTQDMIETFTTVGDSSRRLVEKIFRERMQRKMGTAGSGVPTAPDPAPMPRAPGIGLVEGLGGGTDGIERTEAEAPVQVARDVQEAGGRTGRLKTSKPRGLG